MKQLIIRTLLLIVLSVTTGVQARAMLTEKLTFSSYYNNDEQYYALTVDGFGEQWSSQFYNEEINIDEEFGLSDITIKIRGIFDFSRLTHFNLRSGAVITISSNYNILYGATVKGVKDDIITGCTSEISEDRKTITITIPPCSFKYIYLDYVTHEPITAQNTTISGVDDEYAYLGKDPEPVPTVKFKNHTLTEGTDYTVTHNYGGSLDNGDRWGSVTIEGTGEYVGSVTKTYAIRKVALTDFAQLGTNIYGIATQQQLYGLSAYVSAGNTCQGLTFRQTADITCDNTFTPIGSVSHRFKGTYDGQNYVVSDCIYLGGAIDGINEIGAIVGLSNYGIFKNSYYTYAGFTGKDTNGNTATTPAIGSKLSDTVDELTGFAPHDAQDNSGFVTLLAARTAALTAVERATPLSTAVDFTLTGRTLYKDGYWNTLCLPFDVELAASPPQGRQRPGHDAGHRDQRTERLYADAELQYGHIHPRRHTVHHQVGRRWLQQPREPRIQRRYR